LKNNGKSSSSGELYAFSDVQHQVMKYDGEKNVWTAVTFLPQSTRFLNCVAQFGDWIFVSGSGLKSTLVVGKTVS
jgi:hypothetical protein